MCALAIGSYGAHCVFRNAICGVQECVIDIEGVPSGVARHDIALYIMQQWQKAYVGYDQLCAQAMERFKWIQSIDIVRMPHGKTCFAIVTHKPLYIVNDGYVVTNTGILLEKDFFDPIVIGSLRSFSVLFDAEAVLSDACKQFVTHVSPTFFDTYLCVWENDNTIRFKDKQNLLFSILCRPDALPDDHIINHCNTLKQEVMSRVVGKAQRAKSWIADTRFQGQIVLSQEHKGGNLWHECLVIAWSYQST